MGLNRADIALLNSNMQGMTDAILANRRLNLAQQEEDNRQRNAMNEEIYRKKMLENSDRQTTAYERRATAEQEGKTKAYLQGPNGGTAEYEGPASGLDAWTKKGFKMITPPNKNAKFGRYSWPDPYGGTVTFDLDTEEDLNRVQALAKQSGTKRQGFKTGPIANKEAWENEYKLAEEEEATAQSMADDDEDKGQLMKQAAERRKNADLWFKPKNGEDDSYTETQHFEAQSATEAQPAQPAKPGFLGIGAKPAVPAVPAQPAQPKRDITIRHPKGWKPGGTSTGTTNASAQGKKLDAATAKAILQEAGGDKNKAREIARQRGYSF